MKQLTLALIATGLLTANIAYADDSDLKAQILLLKQQMQQQQKQIQQQAEMLEKLQDQANILDEKQDKTAAAVASAPASSSSSMQSAKSDTTLGGYGEIAYNDYTKDSSRNQADLKRFVIFLGHRFTDQLTFNSEVEWEHAVTSADDQGESEIEQAYLNYAFKNDVNLKAGLFLMPFGFLNESHEPPVFYGVERNEVETRIIPSTWREGGIGINGRTDSGLVWNTGITTGFDMAKLDDASAPLRGSHQELQLAKARDLAYYGALNYRGIPGFTLGGALFTGNSFQGNADFKKDAALPDFSGINGRITLWDVHSRLQRNGWDLQALYAKGSVAETDKIDSVIQAYNAANSATTRTLVPSEFYGWLLQAADTVWERDNMSLSPFVRYESYNTQSKMPSGFTADPANADRVTTIGLSFKPDPQVVIKADYQRYQNITANNRFNLGLGYMF